MLFCNHIHRKQVRLAKLYSGLPVTLLYQIFDRQTLCLSSNGTRKTELRILVSDSSPYIIMELCGYDKERGELTPAPRTPVLSSSTEDEIRTSAMLHTPSPIFLNPMTEEDWSTRQTKISSSLHLSLASDSNDATRKLASGVQLQLLIPRAGRGDSKEELLERKAVTLRFDETKSILCFTFEDEEDEKKGDDDDTVATAMEPLNLPLSAIASIQKQKKACLLFTLQLKYPVALPEVKVKRKSIQLSCPSAVKKEKITEGLQTLLDRPPQQLLRRRHSRVLPRSFSPLDERFSPMSLTEDPSREDATISPASSSSPVSIHRPKQHQHLIHMHEAGGVPSLLIMPDTTTRTRGNNHCFFKPPMTPSEQGMELMLVDARTPTTSTTTNGALKVPLLSDSSSDSSDDSSSLERPVGELLGFHDGVDSDPQYQMSPLGINPWCDNSNTACALAEVTDAFAELFGVGAVNTSTTVVASAAAAEPKEQNVEDLLFGSGIGNGTETTSKDLPDGSTHAAEFQCFGAALLVAEDMAAPHAPSLVLADDDDDHVGMSRKPSNSNLQQRRNDHIRNRSENANGQARHLQDLRNTMTFEAIYSKRVMPHLQISKSIDADETIAAAKKAARVKQVLAKRPSQFSLFKAVDDVFDHLYGFDFSEQDADEDVLYYDSDPEHVRERTCRRGSRQATAEHWNRSEKRRRRFPKLQFPKNILRRSSSLSDGDIKVIVDMMKSCKMHLLWHPNPSQDGVTATPRPCCIQAWIERGTYLLNQNFVQPKFMWKPAFESQLGNKRQINLRVEFFDLLEIARIDNSPKGINRTAYPLVHEPSCFAIKTKTDYFLFQAQSVGEKFQIVFGLKLVVARLASLLIVRDMTAVEEFFEPTDAVVPGQAPAWATGK